MNFSERMYAIQLAFSRHEVKLDSRYANRSIRLERGERLPGSVNHRGNLHALSFPLTLAKVPFEVITQISVLAKNVYSNRTYLPRQSGWVDRLHRVELVQNGVAIASSDESKHNEFRYKLDYNVIVPFAGFLDESKVEIRLIIDVNTEISPHLKKHASPWIRDERWSVVVHGGNIEVDKFAWARDDTPDPELAQYAGIPQNSNA